MENVLHRASVTTKNQTKFYVCSTWLTFKNRYTKHKYIFRHEKHSNTLKLTNKVYFTTK